MSWTLIGGEGLKKCQSFWQFKKKNQIILTILNRKFVFLSDHSPLIVPMFRLWCKVKLMTLSDFKNHFQAQHRVNATSRSQRFTCAFCQCQFTKQNLFTHHMVRVHLEDRYSLVKELKPKKEFQNLSKISKPSHHQKRKQVHHQRQEPDQDLELLKAIEILEKSIDKEDEESVKDNTLG